MAVQNVAQPETEEQGKPQPEFAIQRVYTKDLSFESPEAPFIFKGEWKPEMKLDLHTSSKHLEANAYEIILSITATVKSQDKVAFLIEVKQAGIFTLKNFSKEQMGPVLGSVCPAIIFPYAREVISDIVTRGGFPQLCLAPVNFDALYAQHLQQQQQKQTAQTQGDSAGQPIQEGITGMAGTNSDTAR